MKYFFLTVLIILAACTSSDRPEDLIEREQMAKIIMKIHILEAKINHTPIDPYDSIQSVYNHFEKLLFQDFNITQEQYERSFNYYVDHPTEFEKIYVAVVDSLMQREKIHQ